MSTDDPEAAYKAAEAQLRAYYFETTARYRAAQGGGASEEQGALVTTPPEWTWTEREQEMLSELRDKAADAALALLQARGWFRGVGTAP